MVRGCVCPLGLCGFQLHPVHCNDEAFLVLVGVAPTLALYLLVDLFFCISCEYFLG